MDCDCRRRAGAHSASAPLELELGLGVADDLLAALLGDRVDQRAPVGQLADRAR